MVVNYFNFVGIALLPFKTDPPLIVYADAVLTGPIPIELLKAIARGDTQIIKGFCRIRYRMDAGSYSPNTSRSTSQTSCIDT